MKLNYREDIDGLRAIAVLSVILNHLGIGLFSGGFIGVDVFFVISGFLITSIIINDINLNKFSLTKFYGRRIRRIFPALFTVMAFTVVVCTVIYDPEKLAAFGKSVVTTTFFVSNIYFWKEAGYFDISSQLKPLLHTWSLAVEEQFYILFPLFMVFVIRFFRTSRVLILSTVALISFGFCIYGITRNQTGAFYLAHLRAWELLIGAILSMNIMPNKISKKYGDYLGFAGVIMVFLPIFRYTDTTLFPGFSAAPPVLGTAFIIYGGIESKSIIRRVLSLPPLVFIGKISYSLYLWHWPLIIFGKYYAIRPLTSLETASILTITFVLSVISWRWIETPFRSESFLNEKQVFTFAATAMVSALIIGVVIYSKQGFPSRDKVKIQAEEIKANELWNYEKCDVNYGDNPDGVRVCEIGAKSKTPSFLVWGDSHVSALGKAINISSSAAGFTGLMTYDPGCPSLLDMIPHPLRGNIPCTDYNRLVLQYLNEHPEITKVILVSRWTVWVEGTPFEQEEGPSKYFLIDTLNKLPQNTPPEDALFILGLERTIKALTASNHTVVIVTPTPEIGYDVPSANFIALQTGRDLNKLIAPTVDKYLSRNKKTMEILNYFREKYDIQIVEPWKILCPETRCRVTIEGLPLYKDDDHLSAFGSEIISPAFNSIFNSSE